MIQLAGSHPEIPIYFLETYLATGGGGGCKSRFFAWRVNFTRHIKCLAGKILEAAGKLLLAGSTLGSAGLGDWVYFGFVARLLGFVGFVRLGWDLSFFYACGSRDY